jgi:Lipase (class 3)
LNDVQKIYHSDRVEVAQMDGTDAFEGLEDDVRLGHRWMRFATAAYGSEMVRSAVDIDIDASEFLKDDSPFRPIAIHTQLLDDCILFVHAGNDHDYEKHVLHHFVAVDHQNKSVVLAIRGTLSLSGAIVDIQGMSAPFCPASGVKAQCHKGISEMAKNLWDQSGKQIIEILDSYPDYKLVVTGHRYVIYHM